MTVRTRAELIGDAEDYLPDNTGGEISPADVRQRIIDLADSAVLPEDGGGGSGTVTSVSVTVPTGLQVSGSPITTSGTFAVTYESGYSIPTTTKQGQWDTAYGWGNHASGGYLTTSAAAAAYQPLDSDLTSWAGVTRASGFDTFAATPSSANLRALLTDEAGTGIAYFVGGALGTPASGSAANLTGLPVAGITGSTSTALGVGSLEIGHASDTTLSRSAAGVLAVEGKRIADLATENQPLTGGATVTSKSLGTITTGTLTLDVGDCPLQDYTANGAHTLAPGTVTGSCLLDVVNGASAGARTLSGWTKVEGSFTNTNGHKFRCHCSVGTQGSLLIIQALQ